MIHITIDYLILQSLICFRITWLHKCHHIRTVLLMIISICKSTAVTKIKDILHIGFAEIFLLLMFEKLINVFPVIRNHTGSIRRLLHSSLNLERINTSLVKLLQILNPTHILKTQYITVFLISFVILIKYRIRKTARLRATSSVTASTAKHAAEQTLSGIAITQCTVHKCFQFHTGLIINPFHLSK